MFRGWSDVQTPAITCRSAAERPPRAPKGAVALRVARDGPDDFDVRFGWQACHYELAHASASAGDNNSDHHVYSSLM